MELNIIYKLVTLGDSLKEHQYSIVSHSLNVLPEQGNVIE